MWASVGDAAVVVNVTMPTVLMFALTDAVGVMVQLPEPEPAAPLVPALPVVPDDPVVPEPPVALSPAAPVDPALPELPLVPAAALVPAAPVPVPAVPALPL